MSDDINKMIADAVKEAIEEFKKEHYEPLQQELEKYKPKEKSEKEIEIEQREKNLFQKEINLILKDNGLQQFAGFFNPTNIEELNKQIEDFNKILKEKDSKNNFVPNNHPKNNDAYSVAEKNKDVVGMLTAKLFK